jgi:autotransporter-associated beta strand protein
MKRLFGSLVVGFFSAFILMLGIQTSTAGSATWKENPISGDWNTATNWTPQTVPNSVFDTATFASSNTTLVSLSATTQVEGIVFDAGASAFTISNRDGFYLAFRGTGIVNNSGITQSFVAAAPFGNINFLNSSTAGSDTSFTIAGEDSNGNGVMFFEDTASADHGTFTVNGGTTLDAVGGQLQFDEQSTAAAATLIANGGSNGGLGGTIYLAEDSDGGRARVELFGNGVLYVIYHHQFGQPTIRVGSIEGNGTVELGNFDFSVGLNGLSTTFSGVIAGEGGRLIKNGRGTLTLTNASTYTGGTKIRNGTLLVKNKTGSATGPNVVDVSGGTLGGQGKITGAVIVGSATAAAVLAPGVGIRSGTLTLRSTLAFGSTATFQVDVNSSTVKADKVSANGVTINAPAQVTITDHGTGMLAAGTVFTIISNTSANPIVGTFPNLPDGSTFTHNGNTYQVNYEGGDGNDLTLTVIP